MGTPAIPALVYCLRSDSYNRIELFSKIDAETASTVTPHLLRFYTFYSHYIKMQAEARYYEQFPEDRDTETEESLFDIGIDLDAELLQNTRVITTCRFTVDLRF